MSILPPAMREGYRKLEETASNAFVQRYGKFLNPKQQDYLSGIQTLFVDYDTAGEFSEEWDKNLTSVDPKDSEIKGTIYMGYSVGTDTNQSDSADEEKAARQYWGGRLVVFPLDKDELYEVDTKWLMSQDQFTALTDKMDIKETFASIPRYVHSNVIAGNVLHEKVHGVQDYRIPQPILEAAAHYYQREISHVMGWYVDIGNNMNQFADLYGECLADPELGNDVHLLLFGNIPDEARRSHILQKLKDRFTPEKIEELSKYHENEAWENRDVWIQWETNTVAEVTKAIEERRGVHER